jgi:hypothetical protein
MKEKNVSGSTEDYEMISRMCVGVGGAEKFSEIRSNN